MKKQIFTIIILSINCSFSVNAQIPNYVPTDGLVGWWPFNGNANDESGIGNNATVNGAMLSTDRFGNLDRAYSFDGSNDYLISNGGSQFNPQNLSIGFWCSFNDVSSFTGTLITLGSSQSCVWGPYYNNFQPGIGFGTGLGCGGTFNGIPSTLTSNNWTFITILSSGITTTIYQNGVYLGESINNFGSSCSNNNLYFGVDIFGTAEYFGGKLDDIGIWNRILTECEINNLYNAQLGSSNSIYQISCDSYTWNGTTYDQSGQYTFQTFNTMGCDSTAVLNLTIKRSSSATQTQTALDSYTWPVNGQTYTQSGIYTAVIPNAAGCDSTITLNLSMSYTGLDDVNVNSFEVFPNPASNELTILIPDIKVENEFQFIDASGRIVMKGKLYEKLTSISLKGFDSGTYLLKVGTDSLPVRVVKE